MNHHMNHPSQILVPLASQQLTDLTQLYQAQVTAQGNVNLYLKAVLAARDDLGNLGQYGINLDLRSAAIVLTPPPAPVPAPSATPSGVPSVVPQPALVE